MWLNFINIKSNSSFSGTCTTITLQGGDTFNLKDLLSPNYKLLDLLKGTIHLFKGKISTDFTNQIVYLYPSYKSNLYNGETCEGYFIDNEIIDLTDRIQINSEKIDTVDSNKKRYKTIKFNGNGDSAIDSLNLDDDKFFGAHTIDFGNGYADEIETDENPFFEATLNILTDALTTNGSSIDLPTMLDNSDNNISFDIKPRVLYWQGSVKQFIKINTVEISPQIKINATTTDSIPYAYQLSNCFAKIVNTNLIKHNVVYGTDINKKDLYSFFYKRWIFENDISLGSEYLIFLNANEFNMYNLRSKFIVTSLGRTVMGRITEIRDFDSCKTQSTPIVFLNERQVISCYDEVEELQDFESLYCKQNKPEIIITELFNDYLFSLGGTNNSTVTSVVYEYKYLDVSSWTTGTHFNNPERSFEVRMTVSYSDCPLLKRNQIKIICQNYPEIQFNYNEGSSCFGIEFIGQINSSINSYILTYSINGGTTTSMTLSDCISVSIGDDVQINAVISYDDSCADSSIDLSITIP